jgi:hypothetical protein
MKESTIRDATYIILQLVKSSTKPHIKIHKNIFLQSISIHINGRGDQ